LIAKTNAALGLFKDMNPTHETYFPFPDRLDLSGRYTVGCGKFLIDLWLNTAERRAIGDSSEKEHGHTGSGLCGMGCLCGDYRNWNECNVRVECADIACDWSSHRFCVSILALLQEVQVYNADPDSCDLRCVRNLDGFLCRIYRSVEKL
jgi:hypothetical protein